MVNLLKAVSILAPVESFVNYKINEFLIFLKIKINKNKITRKWKRLIR